LLAPLAVALTVGCGGARASPGDAAWWTELAQPPPAADAWPLAAVAPADEEAQAAAPAWRPARGAQGEGSGVCHDASGEAWRPLAEPPPADFTARVLARTAPGETEAYGLAFRYNGTDDYYLARVDTRNDHVRLYRRSAGATTLLAARNLGVSVGQWHELAVHAAGSSLAVALDGEPLLRVADDDLRAGGLALWASPGTRVCIQGLWLAPSRVAEGAARG